MINNTSAARIKVFGIGGGGSNTIDFIRETKVENVTTYALNTDDQALHLSKADNKIRLGKKLTKGLGAGALPEIGARAAEEAKEEIIKALANTDILFIAAGMGGGTGTGAAPVVAKLAKELGILTIGIITFPFNFEGRLRREMALEGAKRLGQAADVCISISNQTLIKNHSDKCLEDAFILPDGILRDSIVSLLKAINTKSVLGASIDLNTLKTLFTDAGFAVMSMVSSEIVDIELADQLLLALEKSINAEMLEKSIQGARSFVLVISMDEEKFIGDYFDISLDFLEDYLGYSIPTITITPEMISDYGNRVDVTLIATNYSDKNLTNEVINSKEEKMKSDFIFDGL